MSTATKTLELLGHFSPSRPEIGLSQLCRLAKRDKASTYRHLQALEETGFVEQNPLTKHYRLGPALLQLARIREQTVPRRLGAEAAMQALSDAVGETTHCSVLSGTSLFPLLSCDSVKHSTRVVIDTQNFPLHATASGLCALSFGPAELFEMALQNLQGFTPQTIKSSSDLKATRDTARATGLTRTVGSFEAEVSSMSAPLFDQTGLFAGAVTVACVSSRFTRALEHRIAQHLMTASQTISRNWGGQIPNEVAAAWANTLSTSLELDPAS